MGKLFLFGFIVLLSLGVLVSAENFSDSNVVACPEDAKVCADGIVVGRIPPNCDFAECSAANCVAEEGTCAGFAGIKCCEGLDCKLDSEYQDASGTCVKKNEGLGGLRIASPILFFIIAFVLIILSLKIMRWMFWIAALIAIVAAIWFLFGS